MAAPNTPGRYYLATTFQFADGTQIEYFNNLVVEGTQQLGSYIHVETTLSGMAAQNINNNAYDLFDPATHPTAIAQATYYFQADPAAQLAPGGHNLSTSYLSSAFLNRVAGYKVFARTGLPSPDEPLVTLPFVTPSLPPGQSVTSLFSFTQNSDQRGKLPPITHPEASDPAPPGVTVTHLTPAQTPIYFGVRMPWRVIIREPVDVRHGDAIYLDVGSYVLDNGFTGPINGNLANMAENFGEGKGFLVYANPGALTTTFDPADPTHIRLSWDAVNPTAIDAETQIEYRVRICPVARFAACGPWHNTTDTSFPSSTGWASLTLGASYAADLYAVFTVTNPTDPRNTITIQSDDQGHGWLQPSAAVEQALRANRVVGSGFDSLTVVPAVSGAPYTLSNGGLTMHVTYQARRTVVLRYHLVQLREVPP